MRHIIEEFNRIALANPSCKLQLFHNEKELFYLEKNNGGLTEVWLQPKY